MPTYRVTQPIAAPTTAVWEVLSDVVAWPKWLPTMLSVEPLDSERLAVGAKFKIEQPKLRPAIWEVRELEVGRSFLWQSSSTGLLLSADHVVRRCSDQATEVSLEFRLSGFLSPLAALFAGRLIQRYMAAEGRALRERVERPN